MTQTGIIGIHVEANSPGYSRDTAIAAAMQVGGGFCVVVNDPLLCMMLLDIGVTPIYRINRQGLLDDNGHQKGYQARDYVRQAAMETPDKRVLISLVNEPGQNDLQVLNDFILDGVIEANALGRKLVALNFSYGNPEPSAWTELAPCARALAAGGHYVGFHEGVDAAHPTLATCYPDLIGRFLDAQKRFGFKTLITEWAASKDAYNGWQTWMSASQYASVTEDAARLVYAPNGVAGVMPFTLFKWQTGFDYYQSDELKASFKGINLRNPVITPAPVPPKPTYPDPITLGAPQPGYVSATTANLANVRKDPTTKTANVVGSLFKGDVVSYRPTTYANEGYTWTRIEAPVSGWMANVATITAGAPPVPDTPIISITVPYVSQNGTTATRFRNECGVASGLILARWRYQKAGLLDPTLLTVDDAAAKTSLLTVDDGLTLVEVQTMLRGYGVAATTEREVTPDRIIEFLRAGRPVLVLVNQKYFGGADTGHFVVVNAFGERGFWVMDPDKKGANWYITRDELDKALKEVTKFAAWTNQGLVAA